VRIPWNDQFPPPYQLFMDFKLTDVVGAATATVALVIGSSIFLQILANKSTAIFERYRGLTGEYRAEQQNPERRNSLEDQITLYYWRCRLVRHATTALIIAVVAFVITIVVASFAVIFPNSVLLKVGGTALLVFGLVCVAIGAAFEFRENQLLGVAIGSELEDFPNLPKQELSAQHTTK
jgi:hypothetical protein